jgi:hypothetical protein
MSRVCVALSAGVLCVGLRQAPADGQPVAATNSGSLLENSSFEAHAQPGQAPPGWSLWTQNETGYRCEIAQGGHSGKQCLKVEGAGVRAVVFGKGVPIDRSKRYALRG